MQCTEGSGSGVAMGGQQEFSMFTPLWARESLMLSQAHFNQQPLEFLSVNISESFAKFPFPWPQSSEQLLLVQEQGQARAWGQQLQSSHSNRNSADTLRSSFPFPYLFCISLLYQAKCFKDKILIKLILCKLLWKGRTEENSRRENTASVITLVIGFLVYPEGNLLAFLFSVLFFALK